jgi:hypothetical protein
MAVMSMCHACFLTLTSLSVFCSSVNMFLKCRQEKSLACTAVLAELAWRRSLWLVVYIFGCTASIAVKEWSCSCICAPDSWIFAAAANESRPLCTTRAANSARTGMWMVEITVPSSHQQFSRDHFVDQSRFMGSLDSHLAVPR